MENLTSKEIETRNKQSQAKLGSNNPMYMQHHDFETKQKISNSCEKHHSNLNQNNPKSDTPVCDNLYGKR